ncbi:MAG: sigma-70 family RNA polymerase sigma factor, partial [Verrucomicrobiia bacterium]
QRLIAAINEGDEGAFEVLYYRHRDWVAGLAQRLTGDYALALDVLQETFRYFLGKFPGFRLTAQLKTFLYPVVRHLAMAAREKAARCQAAATDQETLENLPAAVPRADSTETLEAVLAMLPEEQRETLWLRFVENLSLAEVATALSVPLGTVILLP